MKKPFIFFLMVFSFSQAFGQDKVIHLKFIEGGEFKIDGKLDEPFWQEATPISDFWEYFPYDSVIADKKTIVRMLYDKKYIYIGVTVETDTKDYRIMSLKRDYDSQSNDIDHLNLIFDTFGDATNAFLFGITPFGVMREALVSNGGQENGDIDFIWDQKWLAETEVYDDYYTAEIRIPFASLRYKRETQKWRFNLNRFDAAKNKQYTWIRTQQNQKMFNLAYMGDMVFEKPLKKRRTPFTIIPYALYESRADHTKEPKFTSSKPSFGGDAKVPVGNSMNLDLTINPDFSTTDVDEGKTNITRFELNLPEKRQFFLDNSDLFGKFGEKDVNPFFSRRIGIEKDTAGQDYYIPIYFGARLSGKITKNLRFGFLDVQVSDDPENNIPSYNDMVVVAQQRVLKWSNVGFIFGNRMAINPGDSIKESDMFSRMLGTEFNLYTKGNVWTGKAYYQRAFSPGDVSDENAAGGFVQFSKRIMNLRLNATWVQKNYNPELGFVKRKDDLRFNPVLSFYFYPKNKKSRVNRYEVIPKGTTRWLASTYQSSDWNYGVEAKIKYKSGAELKTDIQDRYTYLFEPFDPTKVPGAEPLPVGGYRYFDAYLRYATTGRQDLYFNAKITAGTYYNGEKISLESTVRWRLQPFLFVRMKVTYDYIKLPEPYSTSSVLFVNPTIEVTFSKKLFWTTDIQFNSQNANLGINSRFQWRYAQMSDFFIIYVDNYRTDDFGPKTRGLFVKLTYWLNI